MLKNNTISLLFASRLVEEKGVDILIDCIEKIQDDPTLSGRVFWNIVSDGEYASQIESLTQKYPKNVHYFWKVNPQKLSQMYRENDLFFMPSRFLETFWLTALESLASGTPVLGFSKGGLTSFIPDSLALDPHNPVSDCLSKIHFFLESGLPQPISIDEFRKEIWIEKLKNLFSPARNIVILHDYLEKIGWAEYYVDTVRSTLRSLGFSENIFAYLGKTSPWKRRILFILSIFSVHRFFQVCTFLRKTKPGVIWMHSVLRYIGFWWVLAVKRYQKKYPDTQIFLAHHDVGLLAAYPQLITEVSQIPKTNRLSDFIPKNLSLLKRFQSIYKWLYIQMLKIALPKDIRHTVFSPFLISSVQSHFPGDSVVLFPHSVDTDVFHP